MDRKKKNKKLKGVIYSTNPEFEYEYENENSEKLSKKEQKLNLYKNRYKGGKIAVIIKGFIGTSNDLKEISKMIKSKCATGGSIKNNEIIIQGNIRDKIMEILKNEGYSCKKIGG